MPAPYPTGLPVGQVTCSIYELVGDTLVDLDDLPDAADVTMTIEFLPTVKMIRLAGETRAYRLRDYVRGPVQSVLTAPDGIGSYVLPSTDTPAHDGTTGWRWVARVSLALGTQSLELTSAPFALPAGATVDLVSGTTAAGEPLLPLEVQSYDVGALILPGAALPAQAGQGGKVLSTDGTTASWVAPSGGGAVASVAGKTGTVTLTSVDLTDSTSTGRSVLTAATAAAARTAIGAGTSSLALGTSADTAKAGDYAPTRADISDATANGRTLMAAPALPALDVWQASDGTWPARPTWTGRVNWVGYPALTSTPSGMVAGDTYMQRA